MQSSEKGANMIVQCKQRLPAVKMLSTSETSMLNQKTHLTSDIIFEYRRNVNTVRSKQLRTITQNLEKK